MFFKSGHFRKFLVYFVLSTVLFVLYCLVLAVDRNNVRLSDISDMPYKEFESDVKCGMVSDVYYSRLNSDLYAEFSDGSWRKTTNPELDDFKGMLLDNSVVVHTLSEFVTAESVEDARRSWALMAYVCGLIASICVSFAAWGKHDGALASGAMTLQQPDEKKPKASVKHMDDVAGLAEVKKDLMSLVDFIKNKKRYVEAGAKLPKGVIFYGPPGTGKTLLAKALSGEAGVPFLYASASDFIEMYVGVGAKRVRELFERARKKTPCIIFIDEIDAIGGIRSTKDASGEDRKTINALLTEMDGFRESDNILVIGATNRVDDLDPALVRPGRFTDKYCVPIPETVSERKEVLKLYMKDKKFSEDVVLDDLAHETVGFSPAQIEALLNESAILSVQKGTPYIDKAIIDAAMSKLLLSGHIREDQSERDADELKLVAWHEAGHAVLSHMFGEKVTKVTILSSTSGAGGMTFSVPKKRGLMSVDDMKDTVCKLYGGRAAEELLGVSITVGASNDIEKATSVIHDMVVKYGMDSKYGLLNLERAGFDNKYIIDREVELSSELYARSVGLLTEHKDVLENMANRLLENETLYMSDIEEIMGGRKVV